MHVITICMMNPDLFIMLLPKVNENKSTIQNAVIEIYFVAVL